jgi:uncharacterized membrane protein YhfC
LMGGWERLGALAIQVGLSVVVLQAFQRGKRWWWYALGAHTLVDFTSVAVLKLATTAWGRQTGALISEALVGLYALLALWLIIWLRPGEEDQGLSGSEALPPKTNSTTGPEKT